MSVSHPEEPLLIGDNDTRLNVSFPQPKGKPACYAANIRKDEDMRTLRELTQVALQH